MLPQAPDPISLIPGTLTGGGQGVVRSQRSEVSPRSLLGWMEPGEGSSPSVSKLGHGEQHHRQQNLDLKLPRGIRVVLRRDYSFLEQVISFVSPVKQNFPF